VPAVQAFELDVITSTNSNGSVTFTLLPTANTEDLIGILNEVSNGEHNFTIEDFIRDPGSVARAYDNLDDHIC